MSSEPERARAWREIPGWGEYSPPAGHPPAKGPDPRRIQSLDGLRAISITLVLWAHASFTTGFPGWAAVPMTSPHFEVGRFGVRVFFVLSGFLITGLLIAEHERTGRISLSQFYYRRTVRIIPAYLALVMVVAALTLAGAIHPPTRQFVHALTYTMNYGATQGVKDWFYMGHLWSLAVEEQFYLLWPTAFLLAGPRRAAWVAVGTILAAPLVRVLLFMHDQASVAFIGHTFETTADALASGCLLALWRDVLWEREAYRRLVRARWGWLALLAVGLAFGVRWRPGMLIGETLMNAAIVLVIDRYIRYPTGRVGRVLNARAVAFVGVLSYSIYLWQQLFMIYDSGSLLARFPLNVGFALGAAWLSFRLIEQPALRWRARHSARRQATEKSRQTPVVPVSA